MGSIGQMAFNRRASPFRSTARSAGREATKRHGLPSWRIVPGGGGMSKGPKRPPHFVVDTLRLFPGAEILAVDKPLFCRRCDKDLVLEWDRLYATAPMRDLVVFLEKRRGKVVERIWPDG